MEEDFPRKAVYSIGEVSRITGVKAHVLRYWETQGQLLKPGRSPLPAPPLPRRRHPAHLRNQASPGRRKTGSLAAMRRQMHHKPEQHRLLPPRPLPPMDNQVMTLLRSIRDELLALKELLE